jgi:hypothetical protein
MQLAEDQRYIKHLILAVYALNVGLPVLANSAKLECEFELALSRYVKALFSAPRGFTHVYLLQHPAPIHRRHLPISV